MPGRGKIARARQWDALTSVSERAHLLAECSPSRLGFHHRRISGHQEMALLPREGLIKRSPHNVDEVRYVTEMARRLAALLALQPQLDGNYRLSSEK
jgi:hypothetical protein